MINCFLIKTTKGKRSFLTTCLIVVIPAEILPLNLSGMVYVESEEKERELRYFAAVPYCRNQPAEEIVDADKGLNEFIQEGVPKEDVPNNIFIAIYKGKKPVMYMSNYFGDAYQKLTYPMSLVFPT